MVKLAMWNGFVRIARLLRIAMATLPVAGVPIMVSMYLLITSALLVLIDRESLARQTAICAFYFLTAGVLLLLIRHAVEGSEEGNTKDEEPKRSKKTKT